MANYSYKIFPYDLPLIHNTSVMDDDGRRRMDTDDNRTLSSTVS